MSAAKRAQRRGAPKPPPAPRRNRYGGTCDCGKKVAAGAGIVRLTEHGTWAPTCMACAGETDIKPLLSADRIRLAAKLVERYAEFNSPHFGPKNGICFHCKADIMAYLGEKYGDEAITGCPCCAYSYCE